MKNGIPEYPTCAAVGCYHQADILCNGIPMCLSHAYTSRQAPLEPIEQQKQIKFAVPRGERCQVPNCTARAEYVCVQAEMRYCKKHKHPHGCEDRFGRMIRHTYMKIKRWHKLKNKAKGVKNVSRSTA